MMSNACPVCFYNNLHFPPDNFEICPSCGTEFGNDDFECSHEELRQIWIEGGCKWWSTSVSREEYEK